MDTSKDYEHIIHKTLAEEYRIGRKGLTMYDKYIDNETDTIEIPFMQISAQNIFWLPKRRKKHVKMEGVDQYEYDVTVKGWLFFYFGRIIIKPSKTTVENISSSKNVCDDPISKIKEREEFFDVDKEKSTIKI